MLGFEIIVGNEEKKLFVTNQGTSEGIVFTVADKEKGIETKITIPELRFVDLVDVLEKKANKIRERIKKQNELKMVVEEGASDDDNQRQT